MKCLIIDAVHSAIAEELGKYMQVDTHMLPTQEELVKLIPDYDVLIMRVDPKITKEIIDAAANLKVIGVCSVGLNHVDMDACKAKGVQVFNAPGLNANAVAELTFSKMLDLSRHTIPANYDVKVNKTWDKYKFVGRELRGKTLGILGFGRIGQRVGELGRAFKMNIVAYDPYLPAHVFEEQQATSMGIDELLKVSDFVTIHMPLTPETKDLFNAKSLAEMKDDAVVLNMARGGIVNEQDMYEALKAGKIGGYASDVMENELAGGGLTEGAGFDSPLFECENFLVLPPPGRPEHRRLPRHRCPHHRQGEGSPESGLSSSWQTVSKKRPGILIGCRDVFIPDVRRSPGRQPRGNGRRSGPPPLRGRRTDGLRPPRGGGCTLYPGHRPIGLPAGRPPPGPPPPIRRDRAGSPPGPGLFWPRRRCRRRSASGRPAHAGIQPAPRGRCRRCPPPGWQSPLRLPPHRS